MSAREPPPGPSPGPPEAGLPGAVDRDLAALQEAYGPPQARDPLPGQPGLDLGAPSRPETPSAQQAAPAADARRAKRPGRGRRR
jgi:hypothetical protein